MHAKSSIIITVLTAERFRHLSWGAMVERRDTVRRLFYLTNMTNARSLPLPPGALFAHAIMILMELDSHLYPLSPVELAIRRR